MAHDFSLFQALWKGGWTIGLLLGMSVLVLGIWLERRRYFKAHFAPRDLVMRTLEPFLSKKTFQEVLEACDRDGTFLALIVRAGLKAKHEGVDMARAMEREARIQLLLLEKRLPILASLGSLAPFVGLFGTVLGIIQAFQDLAAANAGGAAVVSKGIAEALFATASGLFVAITAVLIYNTFQAKLNEAAQEAEIVISEINERFED